MGVQCKPILALNGIFFDSVDCQIFLGKCAMDLPLQVHVLSYIQGHTVWCTTLSSHFIKVYRYISGLQYVYLDKILKILFYQLK